MTTNRRDFLKLVGVSGLAISHLEFNTVMGMGPYTSEMIKREFFRLDFESKEDAAVDFVLELDDCASFNHHHDNDMQVLKAIGAPDEAVKLRLTEYVYAVLLLNKEGMDHWFGRFWSERRIRLVSNHWKHDRFGVIEDARLQHEIDSAADLLSAQAEVFKPEFTFVDMTIRLEALI